MALDATAQPRVTGAPEPFGPPGWMHPNVSPTGERVLLSREDYSGLRAVDARGGSPVALSDAPGVGFGAAWSPDGAAVAARAVRVQPSGARLLQVVLFDVAARTETALDAPKVLLPSLPRFSPDATAVWIAGEQGVDVLPTGRAPVASPVPTFVHGDAGVWRSAEADVAAFDLPVPGARVLRAVPSPDGRRVALELYGGDLYVTDRDGANAVSLGRGEAPTWRPDGAYVAFMVTRDDGHELLGADLHVASADGQRRAVLTRTDGVFEMNPAWLSADALLYDDLDAGRTMRLPLSVN